MLPIYGTPLGGKTVKRLDFIDGRVVLIPWKRPEDLAAAQAKALGFVLDNSAFTAWRRGEPIADWQPYYEWVRGIYQHPSFQWAAIPDVIDGSEKDNDRLLAEWPDDLKHAGIPVYHMNESLDRAKRLASGYRLIAIGSAGEFANVGDDRWLERMDEIMRAICDKEGRPICKLHGMRMLNPRVFTKLPLTSADSTNVAQNARRTAIQHGVSVAMGRQIMADKLECLRSAERYRFRRRQSSLLAFDG